MSLYESVKNWNEVQANGESSFVGFPEGVVTAMIVKSEFKPGKNEATHLGELWTLQVIGNKEFEGAETTHYLNHKNPNEKAVEISMGTIKQVFDALGLVASHPSQLFKKPLKVRAKHEFSTYVDKEGVTKVGVNARIKGFYSVDSTVKGEDLPLVSIADTLKSEAYKAKVAELGGSVATPVPVAGARPPSAPPSIKTAPTAPLPPKTQPTPTVPQVQDVTTTEANIDEVPDWFPAE